MAVGVETAKLKSATYLYVTRNDVMRTVARLASLYAAVHVSSSMLQVLFRTKLPNLKTSKLSGYTEYGVFNLLGQA